MEQTPDGEASAKLAQHLAVATQIAEAVIRLRQQQTERQAAATEQAAAAARAETIAQHTADRVMFAQALDPEWTAKADLPNLGRAWGAAAGWADTDPMATVAATRVEARLSEMAPAAMARFDELRESGIDRIEAMRDVLAHVAAESNYQPRVFVADAGQAAAAADAQGRADSAADVARRFEATPDDPATPRVDEHTDGVAAATPRRDNQHAWQGVADSAGGFAHRRTTDAGQPHPADVAAESFPRPYTEVTPAAAGNTGSSAAPAVATKTKTRTLTR